MYMFFKKLFMFKYLTLHIKRFLLKIPKFYFSIPKRNSLIIFDDMNSKYIKKCINHKRIYEIKFRDNQFNFFALIYSLIFFYKSTFKVEYLRFFLLRSKLNTIVTLNYNRVVIYQIKKFYPKIKVMVIQNGIFGEEFIEKITKTKYKNLICDYFFCISFHEKKKLNKLIKCKFIVIGSLKNNYYNIKNTSKKKEVLFISQFRKNLINVEIFENFFITEKLILPVLMKFCEKKNLKLAILPGEENYNVEFNYYSKLIKNKNFVLYNRDLDKSYHRVDESLFCVGIDSTLVLEALSRKSKVAIFNFATSNYLHHSYLVKDFFVKEGNFWLNQFNLHKIDNILNYIYTTDDKKWENQNISKINLIPFDKDNSKLKKIFEKLI